MPGCFCVPDASAKCSSARAVIGASSTAVRAAAASPEVNHCAQRDAGISNRDVADTAMPVNGYVKARVFGEQPS